MNAVQINTVSQDGRVAETTAMTLDPGASYTTTTNESERYAPDPLVHWMAIGADAPLAASLVFNLHNPFTHALQTAVAVPNSEPQTLCTAPVLYRSDGVTMGLALVNLAEADNAVTLKLLDARGNLVATDTLTLTAYTQTAFVVSERTNFRDFLRGQAEFSGALILSGSQRFAPLAIGAEGSELFSIPLTSGAAR